MHTPIRSRRARSARPRRIRLSLLSLLAATVVGCGTVSESPEAPAAGPPRGAALRRAVVGAWHGTAHDGTDTTEAVRLTLRADGHYALAAGAVGSEQSWSVHDGLVYLEQDVNDTLTDEGICFVATLVAANHIEGQWAWGRSASDCDDETYEVVLDRDAETE